MSIKESPNKPLENSLGNSQTPEENPSHSQHIKTPNSSLEYVKTEGLCHVCGKPFSEKETVSDHILCYLGFGRDSQHHEPIVIWFGIWFTIGLMTFWVHKNFRRYLLFVLITEVVVILLGRRNFEMIAMDIGAGMLGWSLGWLVLAEKVPLW